MDINTTITQDELKQTQRRQITMIWEKTQRTIAYIVIGATLVANLTTVLIGSYALIYNIIPSATMVALGTGALMQLNTMSGLVLGFYFGGSKTKEPTQSTSRGATRSTDTVIIK